jgi:hypothetical protein
MKRNLRTPILAVIAGLSGLVVLLGSFLGLPLLSDMASTLLEWASTLAAVMLLVGVFNLARVHLGKIRQAKPGLQDSLALLLALIATLIIVFIYNPSGTPSVWLYQYVLIPVESSLMALLAVLLVFALGRMFYRRTSAFTLIFGGVVVFLIAANFFLGGLQAPGLMELRGWLMQAWVTAGARGVLLGVALGTLAAGLRVLFGSDRPYGG